MKKIRIKCEKCGREFSDEPTEYPGKVYVHQGKKMCEDCLIDMGVLPDTANPEITYRYSREDLYRLP